MMAIISSEVATGLRIKGAEGFMGVSPAGQGVPPKPPPARAPLRSDAIAVLQSSDSEARFCARHRIWPRPVSVPHSFLMSALQDLAIAAWALARRAVRCASASPPAE